MPPGPCNKRTHHSSTDIIITVVNAIAEGLNGSCWQLVSGGRTDGDLSEDDLSLLRQWVNPAYLTPKAWSKIQSKMEGDGSVQLQKFLKADVADQVGGGCTGTA